jgi:hypothetical protein
MWNTISEILEIAGYPVAELSKQFGIKVKKKSEPKPKKKVSKNNSIGSLKNTNIRGE